MPQQPVIGRPHYSTTTRYISAVMGFQFAVLPVVFWKLHLREASGFCLNSQYTITNDVNWRCITEFLRLIALFFFVCHDRYKNCHSWHNWICICTYHASATARRETTRFFVAVYLRFRRKFKRRCQQCTVFDNGELVIGYNSAVLAADPKISHRYRLQQSIPRLKDAKFLPFTSTRVVTTSTTLQYYKTYRYLRRNLTLTIIFYVVVLFISRNDGYRRWSHVFGGVQQASAAMTITQTLRYLRNFGYLYDSINHKDFDFNGGPLPLLETDHHTRQQSQPVNLRHVTRRRGAQSSAALHYQSAHHHTNFNDNATSNSYINQNSYDSDVISTAIRRFQAFSNLPVTGQIDPRTLKQLRKPRCGNIDLQPNRAKNYLSTRVTAGMPANYILQGSKWDRTDLTFKIGQYSRTLSRKAVDEVIGEAFSYWSNASKLTFRQIHYGPADIIILFAKGEHGDLSPFDGPQGVLAHAFFPDFGGDTHFDDAERWTHGRKRGVNLLQVAVHELGHALGLDHSDVSQAVMAPFYDGFNSKFQLHADDIKGIRRLYGPPPEIAVVTATKGPQNTISTTTLASSTTPPSSPVSTTFLVKTSTTTPSTTASSGAGTTLMPFDDVNVTRQQQLDDELMPVVDEVALQPNATTTDATLLFEPQNVSSTTTVKPATEAPSNTSTTTTLNTAWWWPPIDPADKKSTDSKSVLDKQHNSDRNATLPFFGTPFDDDLWHKKPKHTVKGKRIHSSSSQQNATSISNPTEKSFITSIVPSLNSFESNDTTTTAPPISSTTSPEEWSLFGLEDLTLQAPASKNANNGSSRKRLHVHKPSPADSTPTSATTTREPSVKGVISYEGIGANASLHIDLCDPSFRIDAVTTIDGVGYMFAGDAYWRVSPMGEVLQPARSILADWKSSGASTVPTHIDAALSPTWAQGRTYLFKGNQYWRVNHGEIKTDRNNGGGPGGAGRQQFFIEDGYPKLISTGWAGVPDNIESAFQWGRSTRTYFTKGNEIWSFDRTQVPPVRGPKTMPVERGFPGRVDAAFRSPSGRTYLFAGDKYYAMSTWSFLISRYYPQLTAERWFGCRPATPSPTDNSQQHNLSDVDNASNNNATLIITPHAAGDIAQINYAPSTSPEDYSNTTTVDGLATVQLIYPTDTAQLLPDPTTTEAGHIQWIHSRIGDVESNTNRASSNATPTTQTGMRDNSGSIPTKDAGELLWQGSSHSQTSNLEALMTHALAESSAGAAIDQQASQRSIHISPNRQPNRTFRNPTSRQVRFQTPASPAAVTDDRGAATSLSMAETNAIALSSRRVASSFGARQFYNHIHQRSKRNTNSTDAATARGTSVFYLRRERKLYPLP